MQQLTQKKVVVLGGSRGVGRVIAETLNAVGAQVMVVARNQDALATLKREQPKVDTLALDVTGEHAPEAVFAKMRPDVLVVCAGAKWPSAPLSEIEWPDFSTNWETDVRASFLFCRAAIRRPLQPGAMIILMSSGAGVGAGSPLTGGYAGAKRMQMFLTNYAQLESDRLGLGLRFLAVAPRPIVDSDNGRDAIGMYAKYFGISVDEYITRIGPLPTTQGVADAILNLVTTPPDRGKNVFVLSGKGLDAVT